uniref:Uncharacterized protein n=1 Tax=Anguilla anguilla TaxID=7936 RepID=A0A0E9SNT8_ANGAN
MTLCRDNKMIAVETPLTINQGRLHFCYKIHLSDHIYSTLSSHANHTIRRTM